MISSFILLVIAVVDQRLHRIHNFSIAILALNGWFINHEDFHIVPAGATLAAALFARYFFSLGAGDIKLIVILTIFYIEPTNLYRYWSFFYLITVLLIGVHLFQRRTFAGDIALAPALCGALLMI